MLYAWIDDQKRAPAATVARANRRYAYRECAQLAAQAGRL